MINNKKIAIFIRNTSQLSNYVDPYYIEFNELGYDFIVFHTSSLTPHLNKEDSTIHRYSVIDIGLLPVKKTLQLMKEINPAGIISYNFKSMFDILVLRMAEFCKVPTIYFEHGLISATSVTKFIRPPDKFASLKRYLKYSWMYFQFLLYCKGKMIRELKILYKAMVKKNYSATCFSNAVFYSRKSFLNINPYFNFNESKVGYSGYPISQKPFMYERTDDIDTPLFLYVHQPFVFHKYGDLDYNQEFEYINNLAREAKTMGFCFYVKLHPIESVDRYKNGLNNNDIKIDLKDNILKSIASANVVAGHYSTALFGAILMKKPLLILDYPGIKPEFLNLFSECGIYIDEINKLGLILSSNEKLNSKLNSYDDYIASNIGKYNNYEHRVKTILELLEN